MEYARPVGWVSDNDEHEPPRLLSVRLRLFYVMTENVEEFYDVALRLVREAGDVSVLLIFTKFLNHFIRIRTHRYFGDKKQNIIDSNELRNENETRESMTPRCIIS